VHARVVLAFSLTLLGCRSSSSPGEPTLRVLEPPASTHGPCTELDFDGDGVADRVEEVPGSCGTGGCVYRAYLAGPAGEQFVGELEGHCAFRLEPGGQPLADVITEWRLGAAETVVTRYRFDGRAYRELDRTTVVRAP